MEKGARVWFDEPNSEIAWILGEVISKSTTEISIAHVDNPKTVVTRLRVLDEDHPDLVKYKGVELANAKLSDAEIAEGLDDDLITLPHLHEPAILHAVNERFMYGKIYTWTGPVLIAVNPFQRLSLYTDEILENYRRDGLLRSQNLQPEKDLGPHVYSIADQSYRQMMGNNKSQAILISGESGAGKTESTKIVMSYLTTLGMGSEESVAIDDDHKKAAASTMERVLQSNPILEAFGNAKTLRNDNSSRFGKFIELGFSRSGVLLGARIETYLLEKVRLGFHASGERNYHIFYQLLRGATPEMHAKFCFNEGVTGGLELVNHFHFTGQGGAPHLREFTDEEGLAYTLKAMRKMNWPETLISSILSVTAGILHLGQVTFSTGELNGEEIAVIEEEKTVKIAAELLGVDVEMLKKALTERIMETRGETITIALTTGKALDARDALSKTIYNFLFNFVVAEVNKNIIWQNDSDVKHDVGVLDIFGFESFAINSFEQLCINFTNEALQQQFNKFIFKMEQAEYEREKIEWQFIEFPDNQDCLDLIQGRPNGILVMLDDECKLPRGSDKNFSNRLYEAHATSNRFAGTNIQKGRGIFCVRHFAGLVPYTSETGFLEKNKDEIPLAAQALFETSPSTFIHDLLEATAEKEKKEAAKSATPAKPGRSSNKVKTVGAAFRGQLHSLMEKIEVTEPHYIRCLKPNDAAKPSLLVRQRLVEQLRYGGVLEAVRVARMGYPVRLKHDSFFDRYRLILTKSDMSWKVDESNVSPQQLCIDLVDACLEKKSAIDESGAGLADRIRRLQKPVPQPMDFPKRDVQLGLTKVFMRKPPHDALESHRTFQLAVNATVIQTTIRSLIARNKYLLLQSAAGMVQRWFRGCVGRQKWWELRGKVAGKLLTKNFRMFLVRRRYLRMKAAVIAVQAIFRGFKLRRQFAATKIQTAYRCKSISSRYKALLRAIIALQCRHRCTVAIAVLKNLKSEQKNIGKLKQSNEKLKNEMASLRAMLNAQSKQSQESERHKEEIKAKEKEIAELQKRVREIEQELEKQKGIVSKLQKDLDERPNIEVQVPVPIEVKSNDAAPVKRPLQKSTSNGAMVPSAVLAEHKAIVENLQKELEAEKRAHKRAGAEVIKLRAAMNGVNLDADEIDSFADATPSRPTDESALTDKGVVIPMNLAQDSEFQELKKEAVTPGVMSALEKLGVDAKENEIFSEKKLEKFTPMKLLKSPKEYFPLVKRGFMDTSVEEEEKALSGGWKVDVESRREREENICDEVKRFEIKMKKFRMLMEDGVDATLWQLNKNEGESDDFISSSTPITFRLDMRTDSMIQAILCFVSRSGFLGKSLGRNKDKFAVEPLSLHDILDVKPGCIGHQTTDLPSYSSKSTKGNNKSENQHISLFLSIKASRTPMASSRIYFLRFKSRAARNDVMLSLRRLLADLQIKEGVSVSSIHNMTPARPNRNMGRIPGHLHEGKVEDSLAEYENEAEDDENVMVPLSVVHEQLNKERENYDRLLIMLLSGNADIRDKEDEMLSMSGKISAMSGALKERDRAQANDSKLIMQLSKKLEMLLMDNEDLRDQNDRLNTRLVQYECEKMNLMS